MFPDSWISELYRIPVTGGRPEQILAVPVSNLCFDADGESFLYENRTGSENIWRKHHVSSVARDIFHYDVQMGKHTQVTTNVGEVVRPFTHPMVRSYSLAMRNGGSFNIYRADLHATDKAEALTSFRNILYASLRRQWMGRCVSVTRERFTP